MLKRCLKIFCLTKIVFFFSAPVKSLLRSFIHNSGLFVFFVAFIFIFCSELQLLWVISLTKWTNICVNSFLYICSGSSFDFFFPLQMGGSFVNPFWLATKNNRLIALCDPIFVKPRIWVPLASFSISQGEEMIWLLPLIAVHYTQKLGMAKVWEFYVLCIFFPLNGINLILNKTIN